MEQQHAVVLDVSRYRPAAGNRDEVLAEVKKLVDRAARADGCYGAQVCLSSSDRDALIAVSRWKSRAALEKFSSEAPSVDGRTQHEQLTPV